MDRFQSEIWPHAAAVLRTARILTRDDAEADDLAQETMLKAFRHLDQLVDPSGAKKWLMTILRNTRMDRLRASGRRNEVSLDDLATTPPAEPAASAAFDDSWANPQATLNAFSDQQIIDALKDLPEEIRWTLLLVDVEGVDQADAAAVLGVPVGTIKSRTHRGRAMLREVLTPLAKELRMMGKR
jgi:RNA polymerase sigma-70 factor (ECF subfamily)